MLIDGLENLSLKACYFLWCHYLLSLIFAYSDMYAAVAAAKLLQSCPTLCDPIDGSPPGSCPWDSPGKNPGVGCHFLLQLWKWKVKVKSLSHVPLFTTPWTAAYQAPPSMGFSRQEYWSGLPLPSPTQTCIVYDTTFPLDVMVSCLFLFNS